MGEVYRAHDTRLDREVALKVLPAEVASDRERLERFEREAKALASLNHPNIVHIYSVESSVIQLPATSPQPPAGSGQPATGGEGGALRPYGPTALQPSTIHFLTMELVEGKVLTEVIPAGGMALDRFFSMAIPMADALATAHEKGIVHRDLKPANVMVSAEGRVKVLDFGLAKLLAPEASAEGATAAPTVGLETGSGVVVGTVGYMSPEQVRGEPVDSRSDVFALGLVLFQMVTGVRAFEADTSPDIMSAILRDTPSSVDAIRPDIPRHLARIIRHCLEKDPERRYQSAKDVRNELEALAKEVETEAILESRPDLVAKKTTGGKLRWGVIAVVAVAVALSVAVAYRLARVGVEMPPAAPETEIQSLAVLPFDNLMNDPEQDYFVAGMHEALITDLSKITALRVISRTSAMRYKESDKSIPEIARELDVDALIEGSVLRVEGQVRITAQLIDGRTDEHLWADSYDRELENVLALLSDVAQAIAGEIEITVTPEQRARLEATPAIDPAAHEAFLRGRYAFNRFSADGYYRAIEFYRQAIEIQPDYAEAIGSLAGAHLLIGGFGIGDRQEHEGLTRQYTLKALELDDQLALGHALDGWIKLYFDWDWSGAATAFERALELNPYGLYGCHGYGDYLSVVGRAEEGLEYLQRAARADPLSPIVNSPVAGHLIMVRRYDDAIEKSNQLLAINPDYPAARLLLAWAYWHRGDQELALEQHRLRWQGNSELLQAVDRGYEEGGPTGALKEVAGVFAVLAEEGKAGPRTVAGYLARAGEVDEAFYWLERAYEERIPQLMLLKVEPTWDLLRDDPRFEDLARRIGIPD